LTVTAQPAPNVAPARLQIRQNVNSLTPQQLADLRQAISQLFQLQDTQGFEYLAGWHGIPLGLCQHYTPLFLPWHRAYLYYLEQSLQQQVAGVTLPWWDWATDATIPEAYAVAQVDGSDNVLAGLPIQVFGPTPPGTPAQTSRDPGGDPQFPPPPYQDNWASAMAAENYLDFYYLIEQAHDTVHNWVGGTMAEIPLAAYDPLFFAHHANVDRAWRIWQAANPGADPPADYLSVQLQTGVTPPNLTPHMTVQDTLDVQQLGYDYAVAQSTVPGSL
jgi:tyrosinase